MGTDGMSPPTSLFFFFNDTATTEIYTLSLHDALPISARRRPGQEARRVRVRFLPSRGRSRWSGEFRPRRAARGLYRAADERLQERREEDRGAQAQRRPDDRVGEGRHG